MKRIIINADDYNLTSGCDRAIIEAMEAGAVSSASCLVWSHASMCNTQTIDPMGVHLRLTDGKPLLSDVPSLVEADGSFPRSRDAVARLKIDPVELYREWRAQAFSFNQASNQPITHLDTHRHTHALETPGKVYEALCEELRCAGVPLSLRQAERLRSSGVRCADYTEIRWTSGIANDLMRYLTDDFGRYETVHLMCHPGYDDADLRAVSTMTAVRDLELAVLTSQPWRRWLDEQGIYVIWMEDLQPPADPLEKVDILFLAWNRREYTEASLAALLANTDWARVRKLVLYCDGIGEDDGTRSVMAKFAISMPHEDVNFEFAQYSGEAFGGPVAIMNHYLTKCQPAQWFVKLDNDVVVPPGWLEATLAVARDNPSVDLLGIEPIYPPAIGVSRDVQPCGHIGGIGLMRTAAFEELPVAAGRMGFSDWQIKHDVVKAWIRPAMPVILLDRLPFEPWASLGARYEAAGWQRPWKHYTEADSAIWSWWAK